MYGVTDAEASPKQALPCNCRENDDGTSTLMVVAEIKPPVLTHVNVDFSSDEEQEIVAAPAAGLRIRIAALELTALENVEVAIKSGSTTLGTYQGAAIAPNLQVPINLAESEAFNILATSDVRITGRVGYYLEAV